MNNISRLFFLVILMMSVSFGQLKEPNYVIQKDSLKIQYKEVLQSEDFKHEKINWDKNNTIGTLISLGFGYMTYYYNNKANNYYSKYKKTGNLKKMNNYWDKTKKYDQLKGMCYIGFEIGFTINIYSFYKKNK